MLRANLDSYTSFRPSKAFIQQRVTGAKGPSSLQGSRPGGDSVLYPFLVVVSYLLYLALAFRGAGPFYGPSNPVRKGSQLFQVQLLLQLLSSLRPSIVPLVVGLNFSSSFLNNLLYQIPYSLIGILYSYALKVVLDRRGTRFELYYSNQYRVIYAQGFL